MPRFHGAVAQWLRTHHGIASSAQLSALGLSTESRRAMLECGELLVVHEGVYRHAIWPRTFLSDCAGICAADPSMVICCGGASRIWGSRKSRHVGLHAITTRVTRPVALDNVCIHRTLTLPVSQIHHRDDGIRVTSPARTVFDLARHLDALSLESVIEQGIDRGMFDITTLQRMAIELCRRGRAGSAQFRDIVESRPAWRRAADSHPELLLREALDAIGVHLEPQVAVTLPGGVIIHPDLSDLACKFFVEIDDHTWHSSRAATKRDAARDRGLRLMGGRIERVSTDEMADVHSVAVQLKLAYRQQATAAFARA